MKTDSTARDLTPKDDIGRLFPVLFMFLSFGNMIVCLGMVLFMQHPAAYALCALLYAALVATELRFRIKSPVSMSMLVLYIGLTIIDYQTDQYKGYAGVIVFSWLSLLTSFLLLWKKPFTAFYSSGRGMKQLHYIVSGLWCIVYIFSLFASTLLMPHVSFLIVPYILCISCGLFTIFLNFFWFGKRNAFQEQFAIGDFRFCRIFQGSSKFEEFCYFYAQQLHNDGGHGNTKTISEIAEIISKDENELGADSYIFVALYDDRIIGCIRCIIDKSGRPLPPEQGTELSFDSLRKIGKLLYVGRLAINSHFRERPDVLSGLFKCFVDLSLSKDISFVVAEGLAHRLPMYLKLGFELLFDRSDKRHAHKMSHGYVGYPVYLNFARLIFHRSESTKSRYQFADFINRYLVERWYKRNALRQIFKPSTRWPWRFSLQEIRSILQPSNERKIT